LNHRISYLLPVGSRCSISGHDRIATLPPRACDPDPVAPQRISDAKMLLTSHGRPLRTPEQDGRPVKSDSTTATTSRSSTVVDNGPDNSGGTAGDPGQRFDLIVLGGGSGGYAAAFRASELGMHVALVEKDKLGGTCLHYGCIPTKAMLHAAEVADTARDAAQFGVNASLDGIDLKAVHTYKDDVVSRHYKGLQGLVKARKVTVLEGSGRLVAPNAVEVDGTRHEARHVVLATGSAPKTLPGLDIDGERIITSKEALALDRIPASVVVLGGGVIGVEFASIWRSFGAEVTIIEALDHLVPNEDEDVSKGLERAFRKRGISFRTGARFKEAERAGDGVR